MNDTELSRLLKKYSLRKKLRRLRKYIVLLFVFGAALLMICELCFMPIFRHVAALKARTTATEIINSAVSERMRDEKVSYRDIVSFEKDNDGQICALFADITKMNELKANLSSDIYKKLDSARKEPMSIALGSLVQSSLFNGKGPALPFTFAPVGAVTTDFASSFSSAGINQTNHKIMLEIKVDISVLTPMKSVTENVVTSVCVAETVIVGAVPDAFTNVQNIGNADDGISGDVVDFGAHNYLD